MLFICVNNLFNFIWYILFAIIELLFNADLLWIMHSFIKNIKPIIPIIVNINTIIKIQHITNKCELKFIFNISFLYQINFFPLCKLYSWFLLWQSSFVFLILYPFISLMSTIIKTNNILTSIFFSNFINLKLIYN